VHEAIHYTSAKHLKEFIKIIAPMVFIMLGIFQYYHVIIELSQVRRMHLPMTLYTNKLQMWNNIAICHAPYHVPLSYRQYYILINNSNWLKNTNLVYVSRQWDLGIFLGNQHICSIDFVMVILQRRNDMNDVWQLSFLYLLFILTFSLNYFGFFLCRSHFLISFSCTIYYFKK